MSLTTTVTRGTGRDGSDVAENQRLAAKFAAGWVVSSVTLSANATACSFIAATVLINGKVVRFAASTQAMSGTLTASTTGAFILFASGPATARTVVCAGASLGVIVPAPASSNAEIPLGMIVVACTATAFNGGTNSLGDSSYVVSFSNFVGPTGIAISTELYTVVPG